MKMTVHEAVMELIEELVNAEKKHPTFPTDPIHAVAIMGEEAGESLQAALDFTYGGKHGPQLTQEIIQTGAMALRCLINFHKFQARKSGQE